jgi:PD-(D/E)XK nuclease superfamily
MPELLKLRASRTPLHMLCPASAVEPTIPVNTSSYEARLGTALHRLEAAAIGRGEYLDARDLALVEQVDGEELQLLAGLAWQVWEDIRERFPDPRCEVPMAQWFGSPAAIDLRGTCDLMADGGDHVRLADWKTGSEDGNHWDQLRAYALISLMGQPRWDRAYCVVIHVRRRRDEAVWFDRQELLDWWDGLVSRLRQNPVTYNPGAHCRWCPRALECPAQQALLRQHVQLVYSLATDGTFERLSSQSGIRAQQLDAIRKACRTVTDAAESVRQMVAADVEAHGGVLPLPEGRELRLSRVVSQRWDYATAWPVLSQLAGIPAEQLYEAITVSKTAVEKIIREHAPRGHKSHAVDQLRELLASAGAVREEAQYRLENRRIDVQSDPIGVAHD